MLTVAGQTKHQKSINPHRLKPYQIDALQGTLVLKCVYLPSPITTEFDTTDTFPNNI